MPKKEKKPRFVITRRIYPTEWQKHKIDKEMDAANFLYNMGVHYYSATLEVLMADPDFEGLLNCYRKWYKDNPDSEKANPYQKEISAWMNELQLNEYDLHHWFVETANRSFPKCLNVHIVQKLATNLYTAIKKVVFSSGKNISYRKRGQTCSLEGKIKNNAIIYHEKTDSVGFAGTELALKPVRAKDYYLQEAMSSDGVRYCRIVRRPYKTGYRYFLQIVMSGSAPKKFKVKKGTTGQDPGISNSTFYGDNYSSYDTLAKGCEKYEKMVKQASIKYERRRRMANPQNYNPDGTIKRGVKLKWKWTKGIRRALFKLKNAHRLKAAHVKNYNGHLSNQVVRVTSVLKQEQMNYPALAKRSKKTTERQEKESVVTNKKGVSKTIHKFKRKRRFGRSVLRRAPGGFDKMLREKVVRYGGVVIILDPKKTASSQTNHITGERTKIDLSERSKVVGNERVQRDLYAGFLNRHTGDDCVLDIDACKKDFCRFLEQQKAVIEKVRRKGDSTGNFGLADFA